MPEDCNMTRKENLLLVSMILKVELSFTKSYAASSIRIVHDYSTLDEIAT